MEVKCNQIRSYNLIVSFILNNIGKSRKQLATCTQIFLVVFFIFATPQQNNPRRIFYFSSSIRVDAQYVKWIVNINKTRMILELIKGASMSIAFNWGKKHRLKFLSRALSVGDSLCVESSTLLVKFCKEKIVAFTHREYFREISFNNLLMKVDS